MEAKPEHVNISLRLLKTILDPPPEEFCVRLWDDTCWPEDASEETAIVLKHPGALRTMLSPPTEVGVGEAYLRDDFDIEGDVESVIKYAVQLENSVWTLMEKLSVVKDLALLPQTTVEESEGRKAATLTGERHSLDRDREAVTYHYDVSNDFYRLFLDSRLVYSCAYFHSEKEDLDTAQARKLDYLCRKLRLRPGDRILDIGCGWGSLLIHAAGEYGVDATGITLSQAQAELGNDRITRAGLGDRARIQVQDYRQLEREPCYDALVSVGMFEHVGAEILPLYFKIAFDLLRPAGRFLNHGISLGRPTDNKKQEPTFSDTYVFPDGELVPISTTMTAAEEAGFEVRDVESLREHYALTLRHWVSRLETNYDEARQHVDERTYRVWRLFMAGGAQGFTRGSMNLHQSLLVKRDEQGHAHLPLTRLDWYT